jgi:hypothetical protein
MADLRVGHDEIENSFQLLGEKEDSISLAIAWALSRSDGYLRRFLKATVCWKGSVEETQIRVHRYEGNAGITDIEVYAIGRFHVIVEAKKGWNLPGKAQLSKYAHRKSFWEHGAKVRRIATLSECSQEYARVHLPAREIKGVPVVHVSWREMVQFAQSVARSCGHAEKRILRDLIEYLGGVMTTQQKDSNRVYVVSLSAEQPEKWGVNWIEIVTRQSRYFHPLSGKWPKEPPNYVGFRYGGQLQSIHHVEKHEVIEDLGKACKEIPRTPVDPHLLYHLGPAIRPPKPVKNGKIYPSGRVWCALDTLLTSSTVSEARDITNSRMKTG